MGGTNILKPLEEILKECNRFDTLRKIRIFMLTDGQVGNTKNVIDFIEKECKHQDESDRVKVFTFGVG